MNRTVGPPAQAQAKLTKHFSHSTAVRRLDTARGGVIAKTFFECNGIFDDSIKAQAETYYQHNQPFGGRWRGSNVSQTHPTQGRRFDMKIPEPVSYN